MERLMGIVCLTGSPNTAEGATIAQLGFAAQAGAATLPLAHERGSAFLVIEFAPWVWALAR